eukprot:10516566-Alexandrium_andersonii.AAC.1
MFRQCLLRAVCDVGALDVILLSSACCDSKSAIWTVGSNAASERCLRSPLTHVGTVCGRSRNRANPDVVQRWPSGEATRGLP